MDTHKNNILTLKPFDTVKTIDKTIVDNDIEQLNDLPNTNLNIKNQILAGGSDILKKNSVKSTIEIKEMNAKEVNKNIILNKNKDRIIAKEHEYDHTLSPKLFRIDYLVETDKDLINEDTVYSTVDKYISNYNSEQIKTYNQSFTNLYQKYSRKQYIIKNINNKVVVIKNMFEHIKKDHKDKGKNKHNNYKHNIIDEIIFELKKPQYLFYDNNNNLALLKQQISNARVVLQYEYQTLINKINVEHSEKKQFENQRTQFIELLETYYIYVLYHKKINQILINNKTTIILQKLTNIYSEKSLLEGTLTYIDNSYIDLINKCNTDTLNQYNELLTKMQSINNKNQSTQDSIFPDIIKAYIAKLDDIKNIYNNIQEQNKHQNTIINYIITKLP